MTVSTPATTAARNRSRRLVQVWTWLMAGIFVLGAALAVGPASAQEDGSDVLPQQVVIFVLDLSGSMNGDFDGAQTKLDVAKAAFAEAFENVSPGAFVGLRVYGDQLPPVQPVAREENCTTDTRLVVPITQVDRETLIQEVRAFEAVGDTPIALALRAANDDIPEGTLGTVVLFSDGRDECFDADLDGDPAVGPSWGEDPCEVAREIGGEGIDLRIDRVETVGFRADAAAESELRCIADVTGGSYTAVETPEDVREVLPRVLAEISSPREAERLGGATLAGTPTAEGAPEIPRFDGPEGGDGRFTDTIEMNSERWYRVPEFGPGDGTFTATVFGLPAQEGIRLGLRMYLPETDQTFFEGRSDDDAGIPRRPTASVRCPGCSISGGPNDVYWVVSLSTENPELGGNFDLELLAEGPAFGGLSTSCREPQECWYQEQIEVRAEEVEAARAQFEEVAATEADPALATRIEDLSEERDQLIEDLDQAAAGADAAEDQAREAEARASELAQQAEDLGGQSPSYTLPLVLALVGIVVGGGSWLVVGRPRQAGSGERTDSPTPHDLAVIGHVVQAEPPADAPSTTESPAVPESPGRAARHDDHNDVSGQQRPASPHEVPEQEAAGMEGETLPPQDLERPEAGWYDDPEAPGRLRWWDGDDWTDQVRTETEGGS